ncbi:MAG: hypothetical protein V4449_00785 [Patescibacteria group bacterium]
MRIENGGVHIDEMGEIKLQKTPEQLQPQRKLTVPAEAPYAPWIDQEPTFWATNDN